MINALAARTAGSGAGNAASVNDPASQQTTPPQKPAETSGASNSDSPATVVSLSQEALDRLKPKHEMVQVDIGRFMELDTKVFRHTRATERLAENQKRYDELLKTEPKPAVELTGEAKDAVFDLVRELDIRTGGDSTFFAHEGTIYKIDHRDGTVWANDGDIPTSEENKQLLLGRLRDDIALAHENIDDVIAERDALKAIMDEAKAERARG